MKLFWLATYLLITLFSYWLRHINLRYLRSHGHTVPQGFEGVIDQEKLRVSSNYTLETSRISLWESLLHDVVLVGFLFGGLLVAYDRLIVGIGASFVASGIIFFLLLSWCQTALGLPFSLVRTFVIEARFGFNAMSLRLWLKDLCKSQFIETLLVMFLLAAVFALVQWNPLYWWLWVWGFLALFGLLMMFVSPYVIEPLFNRFEPVTEQGLEDEIRIMMAQAGLKVGRVMQMDASRRSKHSNAYFTGIGKVKRIVLFDTLIQQMSHREIVAVLAHEIGHWKKGHIWKRLAVAELMALVGAWGSYQALEWQGLPGMLGLPQHMSLPARMVVVGFLASLLLFPLSPLSAWLSRHQEREADRYAVGLTGCPHDLASALIKLSAENLSNLFPHPLYAWFHYSHPPVVERVNSLMSCKSATRAEAEPVSCYSRE